MSKSKAGKEKNGRVNAAKKATAPDVADTSGDTAGQPAGAHLDAPAAGAQEEKASKQAEPTGDEYADACAAGTPKVALIGKAADRVPVQIKNAAHLAKLRADHGAESVTVQS